MLWEQLMGLPGKEWKFLGKNDREAGLANNVPNLMVAPKWMRSSQGTDNKQHRESSKG